MSAIDYTALVRDDRSHASLYIDPGIFRSHCQTCRF
jgi:hypothetical protein